jgi:hypothetical protein
LKEKYMKKEFSPHIMSSSMRIFIQTIHETIAP